MWYSALRSYCIAAFIGLTFGHGSVHQQVLNQVTPRSFFLNFSSASPYIFSSVNGLLEQWSNTFFPNGHTLVACEIPVHTNFYHGRNGVSLPPSPEWLAFDAAMSYGITGYAPDSHLLTYRTTRTVKCLYFDGMSASLMGVGPTEAQMTFIFGDTASVPSRQWPPGGRYRRDPLRDEYLRAEKLCEWIKEKGLGGLGWGFEGIVRMNAAFELIWCDFNSPSLRLISQLNVTAPNLQRTESEQTMEADNVSEDGASAWLGSGQSPMGMAHSLENNERTPSPPPSDPRTPYYPPRWPMTPFLQRSFYDWFVAATRRYGSSGTSGTGPGRGETRAKIDACAFFTFYDPALSDQNGARAHKERELLNISVSGEWRSPGNETERQAALKALMRRRRAHRMDHVSKEDGKVMRGAVEKQLRVLLESNNTAVPQNCSGIDWHRITQEIVTTYSSDLLSLLRIVENPEGLPYGDWNALRNWLESLRMFTHSVLVPFFEYPPGPYTNESLSEDFNPGSRHSKATVARCKAQYSTGDMESLAHGEKVIVAAVEETLANICSALVEVGVGMEYEWLSKFNKEPDTDEIVTSTADSVSNRVKDWKRTIEELMAWLGWVEQWTGCDGPCAQDELCYIPIWPVANFRGPSRPPGGSRNSTYGPPGWGDAEEFLWEPVCVNASAYPPSPRR